MKLKLIPASLLVLSLSAGAAPQRCFDQAGQHYKIDPLLLMSILIKENKLKPKAINGSNRNGNEDVCGMQVNSSHYGKLKKFNISWERLLNDLCICVYTGVWVLAHNFRSYGKNWDNVGMYNTGPSKSSLSASARMPWASRIYIASSWREEIFWRSLPAKSNRIGRVKS